MWFGAAGRSLVARRNHRARERGGLMKTDSEIRDDVIYELQWDSQLTDPDAIGVAVQDGAVTLTGHVPSYAEKLAAARAGRGVYGFRAVANDLGGRLPGGPRDEPGTATAAACLPEKSVRVPGGGGHVRVQHGGVTVDGEVDC